jgi:Na+/melibiose symporter-like transporter
MSPAPHFAPDEKLPPELVKRNRRYVQIDAIGIGMAGAASTFLPVFLARLGASNFEVGLLTVMPGVTGLFLALLAGRFLQTRRNIVPWFSAARLMVVSAYLLTGVVPFLVPPGWAVPAVLAIWALVTLPQTVVSVSFSVVMNAVAGPEGRYELMSRRWSILGLTTALVTALAGQVLNRLGQPFNYPVVFMGLSLGGLISYYFSSRLVLPDAVPPARLAGGSLRENLARYVQLVRGERAFLAFAAKRFIFLSGAALGAPLFPLYFVRVVQASEAWIGLINTIQSLSLLVGYALWPVISRRRGARFVLLCATLGMPLYPILTAMTQRVELIAVYAGLAGIFQAGVDLVFFDELMKTVPLEYSPTFVALAQSLQYLSTIASPLLGAFLADHLGLSAGLLVSAGLRLLGFALFALGGRLRKPEPTTPGQDQPL